MLVLLPFLYWTCYLSLTSTTACLFLRTPSSHWPHLAKSLALYPMILQGVACSLGQSQVAIYFFS